MKGGERVMESLASKRGQHKAEELSLQELEEQTAELLPNRLEMHRRRRRVVINVNVTPVFVTCGNVTPVAAGACNFM